MPSAPCPFSAAAQAWQVPVQRLLPPTPSTQTRPLWQSQSAAQCLPWPQRREQVPPPPQSTSVSVRSSSMSLQFRVEEQPSEMDPQVLPLAMQVVLVQPQKSGVPGLPPPQVSG